MSSTFQLRTKNRCPRCVCTRIGTPSNHSNAFTWLSSRCTDETGYLQPTREELLAVRGVNPSDHYNGIKTWFVHADGKVSHE